ncbi:MAG TPA: hypothetical protein VN455_04740, partial [Methanotrichaceae archaeon]|nr:hypothetical protein [Methanotrichaceae archaeon]
ASADLKVNGGIFAISAVPLQHVEHVITVINGDSDRPISLVANVAGFGQAPDGSDIVLNASTDRSPYTARPFLSLTPATFSLDPGQSQRITLEGDIPDGVGNGGRYALVNIHSVPISSLINGSEPVSVSIDVPVLITISGTTLESKANISSMNLGTPTSAGARSVSVLLDNVGNYHYKALAKSVLTSNATGEVLAFAATPLSSSTIIPTTSRLFNMQLKPGSALVPGDYVVSTTIVAADNTVLAKKDVKFTA